ncbi:MAG: hypothetical protein PHT79_09740 [Syntrophomonadaceae bacterium]|nr:hypothetical protein [Syntrophomonadaceae bacterium]MDD4550024.1 hypothetical protein [Syntrophomonadaceae bacterium]
MKWVFTFILQLPIQFNIREEVSNVFIDDEIMKIIATKSSSKGYYDILKIQYYIDNPGIKKDNYSSLRLKTEEIVKKIGPDINKLYLCIAKNTNNPVHNIYNGDSFIIPCKGYLSEADGDPFLGINYNTGIRTLNEIKRKKILTDFYGESYRLDQYLIINARNALEIGYTNMAIIGAYVAFETFTDSFYVKKHFQTEMDWIIFTKLNGKKIIEKLLNYGPYIICRRELQKEEPDLFNNMLHLKQIRNNVAHDGSYRANKAIQEYTDSEIFNVIDQLINSVETTIEWLQNLVKS